MSGCPFHSSTPRTSHKAKPAFMPVPADGDQVESELAFLGEAHSGTVLAGRRAVCRAALSAGCPAPLTPAELTWAGRVAWRNHARCIGRLYWRTLTVRDHRHLDTADELAASLREHLALAQGDGAVRSLLTVFAPPDRPGGPSPRLWNHQLCAYAGYRGRDGTILG